MKTPMKIEIIEGDLTDPTKDSQQLITGETYTARNGSAAEKARKILFDQQTFIVNPANGLRIGGAVEGMLVGTRGKDQKARTALQGAYAYGGTIAENAAIATESSLASGGGMIHAVGTDFRAMREKPLTERTGSEAFEKLFRNIITAAKQTSPQGDITIRMPVISGGVFRGPLSKDAMARMQMTALRKIQDNPGDLDLSTVHMQVVCYGPDKYGAEFTKQFRLDGAGKQEIMPVKSREAAPNPFAGASAAAGNTDRTQALRDGGLAPSKQATAKTIELDDAKGIMTGWQSFKYTVRNTWRSITGSGKVAEVPVVPENRVPLLAKPVSVSLNPHLTPPSTPGVAKGGIAHR